MEANNKPQVGENRVSRVLIGEYVDGDYKELIQIEYRYSAQTGFDIFTHIRDQDYAFSERRYFDVIAVLLDKLPLSCSITIHHKALATRQGKKDIVNVQEIIFPYEVRESGTVIYKLAFSAYGKVYETHSSTGFGGTGGTRGGILEELRGLIKGEFELNICYFCKYFVEENDYGGTDYRHDQLYCLRDNPEALLAIEKTYPDLRKAKELLSHGVKNMSALHSCSAFSYQDRPRP